MKHAIILTALLLTACAAQDPMDSLIRDQRAQEHYERVERACKEMGAAVYVKRTGTKIRKRMRRDEMLSAKCVRFDY